MKPSELLNDVMRLKALAETGLLYCKNEYDKERYLEQQDIVMRLLSSFSDGSIEELKLILPTLKDYPTAKVDIRGIVLNDKKEVLLVKEMADNKWSIPGGWGDIGYSPKETIVKEFKEETGLDVVADRLLAVFDKKMHPHPPQPFYVYKMVFYCTTISNEISKGFDVLDINYFPLDTLPEMSEDRILKSQVEQLVTKILSNDREVYVD